MSTWSTHQLTELLAALSRSEEEELAIRTAVEHAAEALDSEVGVLVRDGAVVLAIGFPAGAVPVAQVVEAAAGSRWTLDVPGAGKCRALAAALDEERGGPVLVVARSSQEPFSSEEVSVFNGMARVLGLTLHMHRTLRAERTLREERERRQHLLENLSELQRAIAQRRPLQDVLDAVVTGASALLGEKIGGLLLLDPVKPGLLRTVASSGLSPELRHELPQRRIGDGAAGRAVSEGRLVVMNDYADSPEAVGAFVDAGMTAVMSAPVHEDGRVIGSLTIASTTPGRQYTVEEQELLTAFAEHASLALNDAKTVDQMRQALHDPLTRLPNRALFLDRLEHALAASSRGTGSVAVLFVDLDGFKTVNDSLGHAAGDELLAATARRIVDCIRASDTAGRLGGDEFAILVEGEVSPHGLVKLADDLIAAVREPIRLSGREIVVSASIGIDVARSSDEVPEDIIRNADVAMYRAKSEGKGRSALFEPSMHASVLSRLELEADLRRALENDELDVHYQPIVSLLDNRLAGVEALVRWQHPVRGPVPPSEFVPIAEETGLIRAIDTFVLRRACLQLLELPEVAGAPLYASVNISVKHLLGDGFATEVLKVLDETGVDPSRLVLEITESVLMRDAELGRLNLRRLKATGLRVAIDDFGVGFSSLSYLRHFPLDVIKIDKSFIDEISAPTEATLARAIIRLGHALELQVVAEGIETAQQLERLRLLGCDLGQGAFFASAVTAAELELLLSGAALPHSIAALLR